MFEWRRNSFTLPKGKSGKVYINEMTKDRRMEFQLSAEGFCSQAIDDHVKFSSTTNYFQGKV